ncbi:hypothetical protein LZQ00_16855 [Sphingobacterium sp. SRCM116780]|uniref:hypothetical protein n=1 Tax=Sphingobacterium sp. SRCM116780 TaxID=2907623 RepID=UPI001F395385|nr:hypothetical protein [Sphingobacterium sp. SRCM116780]UIR55918.1 hypothetical protein LZQ00_16855 [Sphingobacterium sp. SRCM116780]
MYRKLCGSVSIAYNTSKDVITPQGYAGVTISVGVGADVKMIAGGGISVSTFRGSKSEVPGWRGVSIGANVGVGAGGNLGGVVGTGAQTWLINDVKPTAQRGFLDKFNNKINPIGSAISTGTEAKLREIMR